MQYQYGLRLQNARPWRVTIQGPKATKSPWQLGSLSIVLTKMYIICDDVDIQYTLVATRQWAN